MQRKSFLQWSLPAAVLIAASAPASASTTIPSCGGRDQRACTIFDAEFWANNSGFCDFGLKTNKSVLAALSGGAAGTCENDNRQTIPKDNSWVGWALSQQRYGIQKDRPINWITHLGTHNSHSNRADGNDNFLSLNQYYSMTDQLQMGARVIRMDPHFYFGEMRLCHAESNDTEASFPKNFGSCASQAVVQYLPLLALFAPDLPLIHLLPTPIPELVDAVFIAATAKGLTDGDLTINNRLYANGVREVGEWLSDNPGEVIILMMNDYADGKNDLINKPIEKFLGSKVWTPAEQSAFAAVYGRWPTMAELQAKGKQVIIFAQNDFDGKYIFDDGANGSNIEINYPMEPGSGKTNDTSTRNGTFWRCETSSGTRMSDYRKPNASTMQKMTWFQTGEGRTGSDYHFGPFTGEVNEDEVKQAFLCGYSTVRLDFFGALDKAYKAYRQEHPDKRREAAIWSFEEGDFGQVGPAVLQRSTGRWSSVSLDTANLPLACAKINPDTATKQWRISPTTSDYYTGDSPSSPCKRMPNSEGFEFSYPDTPQDNRILLNAMTAAGIDRVLLKYSVRPIPPAYIAPLSTSVYMDREGTPPSPQNLHVNGFHYLFFEPELSYNEQGLWSILQPTAKTSLANGFSPVITEIDANKTQSLPAGSYASTVRVDVFVQPFLPISKVFVEKPYSPKSTAAINLKVMEPTKTKLTATPAVAMTGDEILLRAKVSPQCGVKPQDRTNGGAIPITGGVTFTDTQMVNGRSQTVKLGTIPINNSPDYPEDNADGLLTPVLNNCGDDTVCATVKLQPGVHRLAAMYARDSLYNTSASDAVEVKVEDANVSPQALTFEIGSAVPPNQTIRIKAPGARSTYSLSYSGARIVSLSRTSGNLDASGYADISVGLLNAGTILPGRYQIDLNIQLESAPSTLIRSIIPIFINVATPLTVATTPLSFSSVNQEAPPVQYVNVTYDGGPLQIAGLTYTPQSWISGSIDSDQSSVRGPRTVRVAVLLNPAGLGTGIYAGKLTISAPTNSSKYEVPVTLAVNNLKPQYTITTNPPGLNVVVDEVPQRAPASYLWDANSQHTIGAPPGFQTVAAGERAIWSAWSDGGAISHEITARSGGLWTANFNKQYEVTAMATPACMGKVIPVSRWFDIGATATLTALPLEGSQFQGYEGDVNQTTPTATVAVNSPKEVVARFVCPAGQTCPHAPPQIALTATETGWARRGVWVTLVATPRSKGIVTDIQYTLRGSENRALQKVNGYRAEINVSLDGITKLTYWATDSLGNVSEPAEYEVKIDRSPPNPVASPAPDPTRWYTGNLTVTFSCDDKVSGSVTAPVPVTFSTDGVHSYRMDCKDAAGNISSVPFGPYNIDKTAPVISGMPTCSLTPPDGRMVPVGTISATDVFPGLGSNLLSFDVSAASSETPASGLAFQSITGTGLAPRNVSLRAERNGTAARIYTLTAAATDKAGNKTTATSTCTVPAAQVIVGDVNGDGKVDCADIAIVKAALGKRKGQTGFDARADQVKDDVIDVRDLAFVTQRLPASTQCP